MKLFAKPTLFFLGLVVLGVTAVLLLVENKILTKSPEVMIVTDFESCAEATGVVMESYPRQCIYEGEHYTEEIEGEGFEEESATTPEVSQNSEAVLLADDDNPCVIAGCSSHLCISVEDQAAGGGISTCEFKDEYMCYQYATCEQQSTGECGWTQEVALESCLNSFES